MATLTSQSITESGIASPIRTAAGVSDKWANSGSEFVEIQNGGGETCVVTFTSVITSFTSPTYGLATKSSRTISVASGITSLIGPFTASAYNDEDGYCTITYSVRTGVRVSVFTLDRN